MPWGTGPDAFGVRPLLCRTRMMGIPVFLKVGSKFVNTEHIWYVESTLDDSSRKILRIWYTNGNRLEVHGADAAAVMEYLSANLYEPAVPA